MLRILIYKLLLLISVIISIPYLTLFERKLLRYVQNRRGPNKVSFAGLLQPIFDGVKLIRKEASLLRFSNLNIFIISPLTSFLLMVLLWVYLPYINSVLILNLNLIFLLCIMSVKVYRLIGSG